MGSYLLVFLVSAFIAALSMPLWMTLGARAGALDATREPAVPRVGGWVLAVSAAAALTLVGIFFEPTGLTLLAPFRRIGPVAAGAFAILVLGTVDDIRPLRASIKLAVQLLIAVGVYGLGVRIVLLTSPLGALELGPVPGFALTVLWLVGITNAFNLLDGADGVAAGSAFFSATAIFIMSVMLGQPAVGLVVAALAGALLGFLPFNFPPARAFLGDSGSMVIGFVLAGLAIGGATKGATLVAIAVPLVAFAVPVFDTGIALVRRLVRGEPVFHPDEEHVHHRLRSAGYTPRQIAGLIYAASAGFALLAMFFINPGVRSFAVVLVMIGIAMIMIVRFLRLHELNELGRLARKGILQPWAVAMNVQLRRAAERLEKVESIADLQGALAVLFQGSEFDQVVLAIDPPVVSGGVPRSWYLDGSSFREGTPERLDDEWEVVCPFHGDGWTGAVHLRRRLGRRSLMIDLNLMMDIVQPALTRAAGRIPMPVLEVR